MSDSGHGSVGKRTFDFSELLPLRANDFDPHALAELAAQMKGEVDTVKDGPDPEENLLVPAGYTYFGQFVDHDLTFDSTSSLNPEDGTHATNLRTPRFDLDCLYGDGPDAQPFMYGPDGATLLFKDGDINKTGDFAGQADQDLLRSANGRAIIGDKRNDENSIVSQIQLAFVKYHNTVVAALKATGVTGSELFTKARNEVRWTYQLLLVEDFLPRIIHAEVLANLHGKGVGRPISPLLREENYALYTLEKRENLPREFVAAAYRFGHSGVRTGYRLNTTTRRNIFVPSNVDPAHATDPDDADSLLGFNPLPQAHLIDSWARFFPDTLPGVITTEVRHTPADETPRPAIRLQFAYKIDPTLVDPLGVLPRAQIAGEGTTKQAEAAIAPDALPDTVATPPRPSLALLNLLRGNRYRIQSGQVIAQVLIEKGLPCTVLEDKYLVTRQPGKKDGTFKYEQIPHSLRHATPLWFYILAEAQVPLVNHFGHSEFNETGMLNGIGAKAQLGWVGGRIVAEVFYGLLDADDESFVNAAPPDWEPMLGGDGEIIFANLLRFAGLNI